MTAFIALPQALKTLISLLLFLSTTAGIMIAFYVGSRHGRIKQLLLFAINAYLAGLLLLYASVIPAERAKPDIPRISLWAAKQPVVFPLLIAFSVIVFLIMTLIEEIRRRRSAITVSSIKESLDHLETGLCFSQPNGLVLLTNHRMNLLSHALFSHPIQNAHLFWKALTGQMPIDGVHRLKDGDQPEFRLEDGTIWSFKRCELDGIIEITAANTTEQHRMIDQLKDRNQQLEKMNARIRNYGSKVDEYVIARERLETRVNLHGFLGQALLMTRHYLQYESGDPPKIIDIWQRNIDVLRMQAEPQQEADTLSSLKNAASAIGMQVHTEGAFPSDVSLQKLIASTGAEALTNAVRHAGAKQLWIHAESTPDESIIRFTNDGRVPASPIHEGGGLSTTRRKIEAVGGNMLIETAPRFTLTLIFGKEVTTDV